MADELKHGDPGTSLTSAEYISVGAHIFNSQATGDILYASSATQLSRLGITAGKILGVSGGIPAWVNTLPAVTLGGTLDAAGQFISWTTSLDSAAVADTVSLSGYEISAGHRALAISSEEIVVAEVDETKFSHKLPVRINGVTYNIMLCAT